MKLPKNYFEHLSAEKYREYMKLLPDMKKENNRLITSLIFTFAAFSFFGIFAIKPTLTTIVSLKKQLADNEQLEKQLSTKIKNLSTLQNEYSLLTPQLSYVFAAIPQNPSVPILLGKVQALATENNLTVLSLQTPQVQLTPGTKTNANGNSFVFLLQASGSYDQIAQFLTSLPQFDRVISIEEVSLSKDPAQNALVLNLRARAYFKN